MISINLRLIINYNKKDRLFYMIKINNLSKHFIISIESDSEKMNSTGIKLSLKMKIVMNYLALLHLAMIKLK